MSTLVTTLTELPPAWRWSTKAGYFAALCAAAGSLITHWIALHPALRTESAQVAATARRVTGRVAGVAAVLLLPALYLTTASGIARHGDGDFAAALAPSAIWGDDVVTRIQLLLVVLAIAVLAVRRLAIGTLAILAVGLVEAVPRTREDLTGESLLGTLFDQLHVIGAEAWLGGLLLLAVVTAKHRALADASVAFWTTAWQRFSVLATASVAALAVSGLWLAWRHMGSLGELFTTTYGVVLLVKLIVVAALLGLGAWNQVAVLPRLLRLRRAGHDEPSSPSR